MAPNHSIADSTALITGASQGIGAATARAFAAAGANVAVLARRREPLETVVEDLEAVNDINAVAVLADITDDAAVQRAVEQAKDALGGIDILVNNAGDLVQRQQVVDYDLADLDHLIRLNLASVFQLCRLVGRHMSEGGGGSIINVSSAAARSGGGPGSVAYAATKGAVSTLTRGLAKELAARGIRVNTLAPGIIDTAFHERHPTEQSLHRRASRIPLGRAGSPDECVGAALFLASPVMSSYVTGQSIEVNGGSVMP